MPETIAIIGSRRGADIMAVLSFVQALRVKHPDAVLVSGGADGVDRTAEHEWARLGGQVISLRPFQQGAEEYAIQTWRYGGSQPSIVVDATNPIFKDYASACHYRDMRIAEECTKLVAFYRPGRSRGTAFTAEIAREAYAKPVYEFEAAA